MIDLDVYRRRIGTFTSKLTSNRCQGVKVSRLLSRELRSGVKTFLIVWTVGMCLVMLGCQLEEQETVGWPSSPGTTCHKILRFARSVWVLRWNTPDIARTVGDSLRHGTFSYLLGNAGQHAYNGNPPKRSNTSSPDKIKELHYNMVLRLNDHLHPDIETEWLKVKGLLRIFLPQTNIPRLKNMFDVCDELLTMGIIRYGQYENLKKLFPDRLICCEIVDKCSREIEELQHHHTQQENVKSEVQQLTAVTENISSEVQDVRAVTETVRSEIQQVTAVTENVRSEVQQVTAVTENVRSEVQDVRAEMVTRGDLVDLLAQHGAAFALPAPGNSSDNTTASQGSKKPTDLMDKNVEIWQTVDSECYVTKAMKYLVDKISKDHYTCVTGVPGSGKSTTIRHAALWLKNNQGFTVYPILELSEFDLYFDRNKSQVFIYDDVLGEYSINNDKLSAWKKYNETIKNCLGKNTKFLTSLRIQLFEDETIKGKTYIFNENLKSINLGDAEFRLSTDEMKDMLRHYLQLKAVRDIEELIKDIKWEEAESFVKCFPLLCKVFSDSKSARVNPWLFFRDPFQALREIFTQIQHENKRQFCGLVLCSVLDLNEDYFSYIDEHELEKDKIELRNVVLKIYKQDPDKDLTDIKASLQTLDGVYITRVGNTFRLSHSIFQNIVLYLCKESSFVLKYGTRQLISDRVRLVKRYPGDNEYVLVYNSDRDVQRLADRFIQELKSHTWEGAWFIVEYRCIDEDRLISCLKTQLFDNEDVSQDKIDVLCWGCVWAVCYYRYTDTQDVSDITTWRGYKLLVMLLQGGAQCNIQYGDGLCAIHWVVYHGELPVIKLLVQYQADCINSVNEDNHSVLHKAVCPFVNAYNNIEITRYLLSLPNLTCLNQRDRHNRTPYWYVVHNKQAVRWGDVCVDRVVPHRQDMIDLYKQKGAILSDINQ